MSDEKRLYEPARFASDDLRPLWHVGGGRMLFAGRLYRNAPHSHSASVLVVGIYDNFSLRLAGSDWLSCRAAIIRAGSTYEFDAGGQPLAVVYVEPNEASAEGLAALVRETREVSGALVAAQAELASILALYEDRESSRWAGEAIADLIEFSNGRAKRGIDKRVRAAIDLVSGSFGSDHETPHSPPPISTAALGAGLSTSRFQHLFKQEAGVSYGRYLGWRRMRVAVSEVIGGSNLTMAAHAAGYYDQPHFAREFRRIFGAAASQSLANVRA
jgi:AraC-like DNA-binding protein